MPLAQGHSCSPQLMQLKWTEQVSTDVTHGYCAGRDASLKRIVDRLTQFVDVAGRVAALDPLNTPALDCRPF